MGLVLGFGSCIGLGLGFVFLRDAKVHTPVVGEVRLGWAGSSLSTCMQMGGVVRLRYGTEQPQHLHANGWCSTVTKASRTSNQ
jgi:hypothetical protein